MFPFPLFLLTYSFCDECSRICDELCGLSFCSAQLASFLTILPRLPNCFASLSRDMLKSPSLPTEFTWPDFVEPNSHLSCPFIGSSRRHQCAPRAFSPFSSSFLINSVPLTSGAPWQGLCLHPCPVFWFPLPSRYLFLETKEARFGKFVPPPSGFPLNVSSFCWSMFPFSLSRCLFFLVGLECLRLFLKNVHYPDFGAEILS